MRQDRAVAGRQSKIAKTLSVVIPCFNEEATLRRVIETVLATDSGLSLEIILVDDGSTDGSVDIARGIAEQEERVRLIEHAENAGKGAALKTGFTAATGDVVIVQDADLEYDPGEYPKLLKPILVGEADVVFGSRFRGGESVRLLYFWRSIVNRFITTLSNALTNVNFSDIECCYKVFRREILEQVDLKEKRFGVEPEICAKICRLKPLPRIFEVGIGYHGRTYAEGKKIGWKDGVRAIYCIIRYNLFP